MSLQVLPSEVPRTTASLCRPGAVSLPLRRVLCPGAGRLRRRTPPSGRTWRSRGPEPRAGTGGAEGGFSSCRGEDSSVIIDPLLVPGSPSGLPVGETSILLCGFEAEQDGELWGYFAVYDGHGGRQAVDFCEALATGAFLVSCRFSKEKCEKTPHAFSAGVSDEAPRPGSRRAPERHEAWLCGGCGAALRSAPKSLRGWRGSPWPMRWSARCSPGGGRGAVLGGAALYRRLFFPWAARAFRRVDEQLKPGPRFSCAVVF